MKSQNVWVPRAEFHDAFNYFFMLRTQTDDPSFFAGTDAFF